MGEALGDHSVPALLLRLVQPLVGELHNGLNTVLAVVSHRGPDADCELDSAASPARAGFLRLFWSTVII